MEGTHMELTCAACRGQSFDVEWAAPLTVRVDDGRIVFASIDTPVLATPSKMRCRRCGDVNTSLDNDPLVNAEALRRYAQIVGLNRDIVVLDRLYGSAEEAAVLSADGMLDATGSSAA